MIIGILLLIIGFTWLLIETDYLTVRLPVGEFPVKTPVIIETETIEDTRLENQLDELLNRMTVESLNKKETPKPKTTLLLDVPHYHPSVFIVEDMPEVNIGSLEILCVRG